MARLDPALKVYAHCEAPLGWGALQVSNIEELFQQHILNKRPRKSKAPAQEGEKAAEKAEEQPEEQAEGEAAGSAGESKPRGRSKTPLGGQKANAE